MIPALTRVAGAWGAVGAAALVYLLVIALGLPLALALRLDLRPPPRAAWPLVLGTACSETLGFVCVTLARRFAPMSVVTPVSSLAATLTVLYAWAALGERPARLAAAGAALACAGIVILSL
jgi:drug/metabolite transporter (DMT)-like permease